MTSTLPVMHPSRTEREAGRVLIVDDDVDFAESLEEVLMTMGYVTRTAATAEEALAVLEEFGAQVALVDVRLGSSDGVELMDRLRERQPDLICVMMTGFAAVESSVGALRRGAYDYMIKPLSPMDVEATLVRCFEKLHGEAEKQQLRQTQRLEAVGRLAGGVAHDFNNVVTAIMLNADALRDSLGDDASQLEQVEEIIDAARHASSLTSQLLAFSRGQDLEPQVVDLNAVVRSVESMLRRLIGERIDLVIQLDPAIGNTMVDPMQLEQALVNLAINARDAMPTGGQLAIRTANIEPGTEGPWRHDGDVLSDSYVMLTVSDTGSGLDAETRGRVFEPFFSTKEVGQGTGLGLSTVYGFVTQSGGHIEVDSEPERGTTFAIYLPQIDEAVDKPPFQATSELPHGSETLLLVEDDERVRRPVANALRRSAASPSPRCAKSSRSRIMACIRSAASIEVSMYSLTF